MIPITESRENLWESLFKYWKLNTLQAILSLSLEYAHAYRQNAVTRS